MNRLYISLFYFLTLLIISSAADTFQYDKVNRLVYVKYDNGCTIEYQYDAFGNILKKITTAPDTSKPKLIKPGNMVITLKPGEKATSVQFPVSAFDAVDKNVQVICNPVSGSLMGVGKYLIKCKALTARGVSVTDSFKLTVMPAPVITSKVASATARSMAESGGKTITKAANSAFAKTTSSGPVTTNPLQKRFSAIEDQTTPEKSSVLSKTLVPDTLIAFSGQFNAPVDGMYIFTLIGKGGSQLWISPTRYPAAKMLMLESIINKDEEYDTSFVAMQLFKDIRQYMEVRGVSGQPVKAYVKAPGQVTKALPGAFIVLGE
ncbi:MAG TPA: RHS repeat domain-containing protein [Chitinispirillaceae bacterium]|nr:RHS repeat domain-containing protein [Chitinispirillaceae bacterium]